MSKIFNVAIIGVGIGRSHIVEGYLPNADKFKVKVLCDLNAERLAAVADEFAVEGRIASFDDVLAMDDIDIIDICTPPGLHYSMVMAALKAGKHVICEKPLVGSLAQVDAVIAEEKNSKGMLMPVFQYRFGNGIEQAKAIIDAGIAGKPYGHGRNAVAPRCTLLCRALARQMGHRTGRRADGPCHPSA